MKKLILVILFTILILWTDLYGKLLVTYISDYIKNEPEKQGMIVDEKKQPDKRIPQSEGAIHHFIGKSSEEVMQVFGSPDRVDRSSYDYEWFIYNRDAYKYMQIGILADRVVTIYAAGDTVDLSPLKIGQKYDQIYEEIPFSYEVSIDEEGNSYQFELSEEDFSERPLIAVGDHWAQLYFDKFTRTLSGVRYMDNETLIKQRPYQVMYTGSLKSGRPLTEQEAEEVEDANEKQILDLTNIMRKRHQLPAVRWDEQVSQVAYLHSKDMKEQKYFSHQSPTRGDLGDRLEQGEVSYRLAGENIAAQYTDGPAAVEGWMNSKGHRKNMLNRQFNGLGVGVYEEYYTQNFVRSEMGLRK